MFSTGLEYLNLRLLHVALYPPTSPPNTHNTRWGGHPWSGASLTSQLPPRTVCPRRPGDLVRPLGPPDGRQAGPGLAPGGERGVPGPGHRLPGQGRQGQVSYGPSLDAQPLQVSRHGHHSLIHLFYLILMPSLPPEPAVPLTTPECPMISYLRVFRITVALLHYY